MVWSRFVSRFWYVRICITAMDKFYISLKGENTIANKGYHYKYKFEQGKLKKNIEKYFFFSYV